MIVLKHFRYLKSKKEKKEGKMRKKRKEGKRRSHPTEFFKSVNEGIHSCSVRKVIDPGIRKKGS